MSNIFDIHPPVAPFGGSVGLQPHEKPQPPKKGALAPGLLSPKPRATKSIHIFRER
jgi:hypothetical protein